MGLSLDLYLATICEDKIRNYLAGVSDLVESKSEWVGVWVAQYQNKVKKKKISKSKPLLHIKSETLSSLSLSLPQQKHHQHRISLIFSSNSNRVMETLLIDCVQSSLRLFMHRNAIFLCERLCAEFPSEASAFPRLDCYHLLLIFSNDGVVLLMPFRSFIWDVFFFFSFIDRFIWSRFAALLLMISSETPTPTSFFFHFYSLGAFVCLLCEFGVSFFLGLFSVVVKANSSFVLLWMIVPNFYHCGLNVRGWGLWGLFWPAVG